MEQLESIKNQLVSLVAGQLSDISSVDAKELGEVVDMIKDIDESMYYCAITKAMKESKEEPREERMYYGGDRSTAYMEPMYDMSRPVRYYTGSNRYYQDHLDWPQSYESEARDPREGRSPRMRKMYMESKEMHKDSAKKMQELEQYIKELGSDLTEMIAGATPEEKQLLKNRITTLSDKITM